MNFLVCMGVVESHAHRSLCLLLKADPPPKDEEVRFAVVLHHIL